MLLNHDKTALVFFHWEPGVNAVKEMFADLTDLSLRRVNKAACGVVGKVRLMIFQSYEGFPYIPVYIITHTPTHTHPPPQNERNKRSFRENRKKEIIFDQNAINKNGRENLSMSCNFSGQSWMNSMKLAARGERKGFAVEESAEFNGSELS